MSIATDPENALSEAADEMADELLRMTAEIPDGLAFAFIDRLMLRLSQARYIATGPVVTEI
jgi:hypothetical protein